MSGIYKNGQWYGKSGGGGTDYTAGDGIVIENDEISTDNMPAEDMSEVASPMPSVMSRRFKYSTEEQVVGEWIDGKPVYQKTWIGLSISTGASANAWIDIVLAEPSDVDTFVNCTLYTNSGQNGSSLLINPIEVTRVDNSLVGFRCQIGSATDRNIIAATLQYTKTTD